MIYAGIGSRETPMDVIALMRDIGAICAKLGHTLRSGAAPGADSAFEAGCDVSGGLKEIYIPWEGFQQRRSTERGVHAGVSDEAMKLASQHHPNWSACSRGARALHARNCYQVLGLDLATPVDRIFCWTPRGEGGGGTGQALRLAIFLGIEIVDLGDPRKHGSMLRTVDKHRWRIER